MQIMQFDWFLSVLEKKQLENHGIFHISRSCWVTLEICTWRISPRMEVPLCQGCQRFEVEFRYVLRKKLERQVKKKIKLEKPNNYEKILKELKENQHPIFLRVRLMLHWQINVCKYSCNSCLLCKLNVKMFKNKITNI